MHSAQGYQQLDEVRQATLIDWTKLGHDRLDEVRQATMIDQQAPNPAPNHYPHDHAKPLTRIVSLPYVVQDQPRDGCAAAVVQGLIAVVGGASQQCSGFPLIALAVHCVS